MIGIEVALIAGSFTFLAVVEEQNVLIGNSINIAGKNRFFTAISLFETERYLAGNSEKQDVDAAMADLESNILVLRNGGEIDGIMLSPLRSEFGDRWQQVYDDWLAYNELVDNITLSTPPDADVTMQYLQSTGARLVASSDALVSELGEFSRAESQNMVALQIALGALNIGAHIFMLYLIVRILRPIRSLRDATAEVKKGNLDVKMQQSGSDELRDLADSFNSMV